MTLVSVIIPAYNDSRWVGQTVRSALDQTHRELDVIVVDDGSTDGTAEVARQAARGDPRVNVISSLNAGPSAARNRGLAAARGEYVAYLDADDRWLPGKLDRQLAVFDAEPGTVCVGCSVTHVSANGRPLPRLIANLIHSGRDPREPGQQELIRRAMVLPFVPSTMLVDGTTLRALGGMDETLGCRAGEDLELLARLAEHGRISTVPESLVLYRLSAGSRSNADDRRMRRESWYVTARQHARLAGIDLSWEEYLAGYRLSSGERRADISDMYFRRAGVTLLNRRYIRAAGQLALAAGIEPSQVVIRARRHLFGHGTGSKRRS
jgi:glycosyltransferase involved in cell wall biosynthesis